MLAFDRTKIDLALYEATGFIAKRDLPDGRYLAIVPFIYTFAIVIGTDVRFYDDRWCFHYLEDALRQFKTWDPMTTPEPTGWHRHLSSGRRRPEGDAAREYVDPS